VSVTIETAELDQARDLCSTFYYPFNIELIGPAAAFRFAFTVGQVGPITLGEISHGSELCVYSGDLVTGYHVSMPLVGRVESEHRGHTVHADVDRAAVYQPVGCARMRECVPGCNMLAVKIERAALEDYLGAVLDRPLQVPLDLAPSFDLTRGLGRSWATLVRLLSAEVDQADSLVHDPIVSAAMCESVIGGLLLAVDHPYRDELHRPAPPCHPRAVRRSVAAMEADPAYPFTVVDLAREAQVSVRALQAGFRQHTGLAPMMYLREVRLARAHHDLRHPDRAGLTVADVAHRWGFTHLGRFAGAYRERYGESPSATLRRSA
jgi:AraC-like DNA-binding protein